MRFSMTTGRPCARQSAEISLTTSRASATRSGSPGAGRGRAAPGLEEELVGVAALVERQAGAQSGVAVGAGLAGPGAPLGRLARDQQPATGGEGAVPRDGRY